MSNEHEEGARDFTHTLRSLGRGRCLDELNGIQHELVTVMANEAEAQAVGGADKPHIFSCPDESGSRTIYSELNLWEEDEAHPRRHSEARLKVDDVTAFTDFLNRYAAAAHTLIVARPPTAGALGLVSACINFDEELGLPDREGPRPGWRDRGIDLRLEVSDELKLWTTNTEGMKPRAFAELIEEGLADVREPTDEMQEDAKKLGTVCADPAKMLELSRGLSVRREVQVTHVQNLPTGEVLHVRDLHQVFVPSYFVLGIPIFEGGPVYQLPVPSPCRQSSWSRKARCTRCSGSRSSAFRIRFCINSFCSAAFLSWRNSHITSASANTKTQPFCITHGTTVGRLQGRREWAR